VTTWVCNVASALLVYGLAKRWGEPFFATPLGRWLMHPRQLEQVGRFYARWGLPAIFVSRFLPAFRAVVPVFAGFSRVPLRQVLPPLAAASALWYGALVTIGTMAGQNWDAILAAFARVSRILVWIAAVFIGIVVVWWIRTRHREK